MGSIRIQLFDWDESTNEAKEPLVVELAYDPGLTLEEQGTKKVSIFAGDDVGGGQVLIPLAMLNQAMSALIAADMNRSKPGIIMPNNKLILPN